MHEAYAVLIQLDLIFRGPRSYSLEADLQGGDHPHAQKAIVTTDRKHVIEDLAAGSGRLDADMQM
jgi:hypothetical protein